jgi:hypothetical protein
VSVTLLLLTEGVTEWSPLTPPSTRNLFARLEALIGELKLTSMVVLLGKFPDAEGD